MYNDIRKYIKATIQTTTGLPVSFIDAKKGTTKPYITYDLSETYSNMIGKHVYTITVDIWDEGTPKNCINAINGLDKKWKQAKVTLDTAKMVITCGSSSGFVADEDENDVHYIRTYDISAYERGE